MTLGEAGRSDWQSVIRHLWAKGRPLHVMKGLRFANPTYGSSHSSWMGFDGAEDPL